jgi:hypothetical protein
MLIDYPLGLTVNFIVTGENRVSTPATRGQLYALLRQDQH